MTDATATPSGRLPPRRRWDVVYSWRLVVAIWRIGLYLAMLKSGEVAKEFSEWVSKNMTGQRLPGSDPPSAGLQPIWLPDTSHGFPA